MTEIELYKQIVQKQDEYIRILENEFHLNKLSFGTIKRQIAFLRLQLEKAQETECNHPESSRQHNPDNEPDRCEDCGKLFF